jgi:type IV secretion system protein VirB9
VRTITSVAVIFGLLVSRLDAAPADPRVRDVIYDEKSVVTVYVRRGVPTHVVLDPMEQIQFVGTGYGSDCKQPDDTWCIVASRGGTQFFVKPKSGASGANGVAISTNRRAYSLRFVVLADADPRDATYRLTYRYPPTAPATSGSNEAPLATVPQVLLEGPTSSEILRDRLHQAPAVMNGEYSMSIGKASGDIAPTLVWDDGRFTYFEFPNNRVVPAVFEVGPDGHESVVNVRMENDLLVADRVAKRFALRLDRAIVGIFNDAFDLDGVPPSNGTTVPGVERVLRAEVRAQ